ncbi:ABC transporter ATP-binding protein [Liquorilactobacillus oeni]|uniref:High-affinity branched-chain amino acid ABC transporter, ATP-binding protein LivF n=1 Tax=Liquorilactobacillus oeni DSM 19972 TaxID=1423777 RepID=A0A0R1MAB5_9LACO|nr:ABC transporter ATP-binding protein [Liquorilactobacillus oeni]KRL05104.1 high-affinity branched-chain amino acid ABC transporter, ATP-binding protein LivF [Liquorilactobacillus oeni DSM 19972]
MMILKVSDLAVNYGAIKAVKGVSFEINEGEIVSLIGANGAGKTTILKTISGLLKPVEGTISYFGKDLKHKKASHIVAEGISHVPEGRHIFPGMSVKENLQLGAFLQKDRTQVKELFTEVYSQFPILRQREDQDAATLSGGEQQMLAIGRALMSKPKLLLLDEPSMGLAPIFINKIFEIIKAIKNRGTTVLLIEQNAKKALSIADRGYVLATGEIKMEGTGAQLLASPAVQKAYLGG